MKVFFTTILLFIGLTFTQQTQAETSQRTHSYLRYIQTYKDLAVKQQNKYKIPASITLAQGLLESGAGGSYLAKRGNNHFGIKCNGWKGRKIYQDDDKRNECFRKYPNVESSYEDHSKFIALRSRYSSLFKLSIYDYKGWAKGLKRCGYATDRKYADKLIKVIEDYDLYKYDRAYKKSKQSTKASDAGHLFNHKVYKANGLIYIQVKYGDSLESISKDMKISVRKLRKYNELPKNHQLHINDILYLEKKNSRSEGVSYKHIVQSNESMYYISQKYGIQIKSLYKLNKKDKDYIPTEGDILKLR